MTKRIFVTVGTDHHPFSRVIEWMDRWTEVQDDVFMVVQHGSSPPSRIGENHVLFSGDELVAQYDLADIVVSQVGPGSISDANRAGHRPIVVPRDPHLGEVVDGHQTVFGDFMAARGRCQAVRSEAALVAALNSALFSTGTFQSITSESTAATASTVDALAQRIVAEPRRRISLSRALAMVRHIPARMTG